MSIVDRKKRETKKTGIPSLFRHLDDWVVTYVGAKGTAHEFRTKSLPTAQAFCEYEHEKATARLQEALVSKAPEAPGIHVAHINAPLLVVASTVESGEAWVKKMGVSKTVILTPQNAEGELLTTVNARGVISVDGAVLPAEVGRFVLRALRFARMSEDLLKERVADVCCA